MELLMPLKSEISRSRKGLNEAKLQRRVEWNDNILKFHEMSAGVIETWVIGADKIPKLIAAAHGGVAVARHLIEAISLWLEYAERQPASAPVLCLNCDTALRPPDSLPEKFIIHLPFANPKAALANGVCASCANNGTDWYERAHELLRRVFPDAYRVEYPIQTQQ
jgi:hypothetical protein